MSNRPHHRRIFLRPWLIDKLDRQESGLEWLDRQNGIFKILWTHSGKSGWTPDQGKIFKDWAKNSGKFYITTNGKENYSKWKTNFRCAINKAEDIQEIRRSQDSIDYNRALPYKVFRFLPVTKKNSGLDIYKMQHIQSTQLPPQNVMATHRNFAGIHVDNGGAALKLGIVKPMTSDTNITVESNHQFSSNFDVHSHMNRNIEVESEHSLIPPHVLAESADLSQGITHKNTFQPKLENVDVKLFQNYHSRLAYYHNASHNTGHNVIPKSASESHVNCFQATSDNILPHHIPCGSRHPLTNHVMNHLPGKHLNNSVVSIPNLREYFPQHQYGQSEISNPTRCSSSKDVITAAKSKYVKFNNIGPSKHHCNPHFGHEMFIELVYMNNIVKHWHIDNTNGCLLFNKTSYAISMGHMDDYYGENWQARDHLQLPAWSENISNEKASKKAGEVLRNCERGVVLQNVDGNINIMRKCKTAIYSSYNRAPKIIRDDTNNKTTIFDYHNDFLPRLEEYKKSGIGPNKPSPHVIIYFGQNPVDYRDNERRLEADEILVMARITSCKAMHALETATQGVNESFKIELSKSDIHEKLIEILN